MLQTKLCFLSVQQLCKSGKRRLKATHKEVGAKFNFPFFSPSWRWDSGSCFSEEDIKPGRLNVSRVERKEKPVWIRVRVAVYKRSGPDNPVFPTLLVILWDQQDAGLSLLDVSGEMSCCLLLCLLLPAPHPMLSSSEAMYSMGIPWDGCSSKNPHSFIGCTRAMFSKPFCKRRGWFSFILRTYFKALRRHLCHFRVWTEQCKEASV